MMKLMRAYFAMAFLFMVFQACADVVINEVQSSNDETCIDELGESPDWIELYNNGAEAVDLSGWGLSDNTSKLFKWTFPEGTLIEAGGYLRVFADSTKIAQSAEIEATAPNCEALKNDLVSWLDADVALATYGEGGSVACWEDQSDYGNNATNATVSCQPKVYGDKINGHAALRFVETSRQELDFNHIDFHGMESMSNYTAFVVAKWSGVAPKTTGHGLFGLTRAPATGNNTILQIFKNPVGQIRFQAGTSSQVIKGPSISAENWNNIACSLDSERETPRMSLYLNRDRVSFVGYDIVQEPIAAFTRMMIGRGYGGDARYFDGEIAEFILYRRELTDAEYKSVYAYLEEKYDLSHVNNIHTSFSLSGSGEDLCLTPVGAMEPCDTVSFGMLPCDTSYGRTENGWAYFADPTPGRANDAIAYAAPLDKVAFSKERGVFQAAFRVELSHPDPEARVYYTTDHSDPSESNGCLYTEPIEVSGTTIIRATAIKEGALPYRNISANSYIFLDDILTQKKPEIAPEIWSDGETTPASYGLSTDIVGDEESFNRFKEAVLHAPIVSITMSDDDLFNPDNGLYTKPKSLKGQEKAASVEWVTGDHVFGLEAGGANSRKYESFV